MSTATAIQIHCPFCNGVQTPHQSDHYDCEFCLQPFTIVQAQKEESRMMEEIKGWLEKKVGASGLALGGVDASSRAFIFQQKVLPDLRRDVDRALEQLGTYGQFSLVPLPVAGPRPSGGGPNPLTQNRQSVLALKNLRARLASEQVTAFAVGDEGKTAVQTMDRRLADITYLSNVVEAASRGDATGYATARRNLVSLLDEIGQSLTLEGSNDPKLRQFLGGLKVRYEQLAELCEICERISGENATAGEPLADRLEAISESLLSAGESIEHSDYSPADSMPVVVGVRHEAAGVALLARWLRAYEVLARKESLSFTRFVREVNALYDDRKFGAEAKADMVEGCTLVVRALRGDMKLPVVDDLGWVDGWVEAGRAKKSFGLFGQDERAETVDRFLLPVWVATISFSRSTGKVFKEGVESQCVALVNACSTDARSVYFVPSDRGAINEALSSRKALSTRAVALPTSTGKMAQAAFEQAAKTRPDLQNARVQVRSLAFLPAAVAAFVSKNGQRTAATCLNGEISIDAAVTAQLSASQTALKTFA